MVVTNKGEGKREVADNISMTNNTPNILVPLYIYAGGKTRLISKYIPIWPEMKDYTHYVEPFFGGGAIWGWLVENDATLNTHIGDVNSELIGVLKTIATDKSQFLKKINKLADIYLGIEKSERKEWYYGLRKDYWKKPDPATLFILMRLSFNGIWQSCKEAKGLFGTPAGLLNHKSKDQIFTKEKIDAWAKALSSVKQWHIGSYESMNVPRGKKTLVYLDPPYRDSYTTYGTGFSDNDQKELVKWVRKLIAQGNKVILANRCVENDPFFEDLLGDVCDFHYFDVVYTAGRRKKTETGHEAKSAREFIAISK